MPKEKTTREPKEKKTRAKKDPNAPKKPLSAYMFFSKDAREEVKKENPEATFGEVGKLLGQKWSATGPEDRVQYEEMAAKDKERYEKANTEYKASGGGSSSAKDKKAAKADEDEDDDE